MPVGNSTNRRARLAKYLTMYQIHFPAELGKTGGINTRELGGGFQ